jgi:hypothetical protein
MVGVVGSSPIAPTKFQSRNPAIPALEKTAFGRFFRSPAQERGKRDQYVASGCLRALPRLGTNFTRSRHDESIVIVPIPRHATRCRHQRLSASHDSRLTWGFALLQSP